MKKFLTLFTVFWLTTCHSGCGSGDATTVIQPGPDYQLNEQEKANLELEAKMRGDQG